MDDYRLQHAWNCYSQGRYGEAIEQFRQLLSEDPENGLYHGGLAACLVETKRIYAAEYEINIALHEEPRNPHLLLLCAKIAFYKRELPDALSRCDDALLTDPEFYDAYLLKGRIHLLMSNNKEALDNIRQAATFAPENADVELAFCEFYYHIGDNNSALEHVKSVLFSHAQDEQANILMGQIQLRLGNVEEAEYHAKFVISQNPSSEQGLQLFSHIKMRRNIFLGAWWRFNSWAATLGSVKSAVVLISGFLLFNLLAQILSDLGHPSLGQTVSYAWLALVLYSWFGIPMYYRALKKELDEFRFNSDF